MIGAAILNESTMVHSSHPLEGKCVWRHKENDNGGMAPSKTSISSGCRHVAMAARLKLYGLLPVKKIVFQWLRAA